MELLQSQLSHIQDLSIAMEVLVENQDWERFGVMEMKQRKLIMGLPEMLEGITPEQYLMLKTIEAKNNYMLSEALKFKEHILIEMQKIKVGRKAAQVYEVINQSIKD